MVSIFWTRLRSKAEDRLVPGSNSPIDGERLPSTEKQAVLAGCLFTLETVEHAMKATPRPAATKKPRRPNSQLVVELGPKDEGMMVATSSVTSTTAPFRLKKILVPID